MYFYMVVHVYYIYIYMCVCVCMSVCLDRPVGMAELVERLPPVLGDWGIRRLQVSCLEPAGSKPGRVKPKT